MRRGWALAAAALAGLAPAVAHADEVLTFDGTVDDAAPRHITIPFQVPASTREIQIDHDDLDADDILDWGLTGPSGWRGWGGGNTEPAVVNELAASRSYRIGPIEAGTWYVDVGKAKIVGGSASYHVVVTLRDVPTLAPQPERTPYVPVAPLSSEARWYAGDFHVHSRESGDADATFEEIIAYARNKGLDFVELSDHNTNAQLDFYAAAQASAGSLLLLPGVEFTTYAGHANGIGATQFVDHKFEPSAQAITAAVDAFHAQGALFALNHPALDIGDACIGCAWEHELAADRIDAIEIVTAGSAQVFYEPASVMWEGLAAQGKLVAAIGGSDDHRAGEDLGAFGAPIGSPTTMVFASELSVAGILEGIKQGKTVVKVRGPSDPMVELASVVRNAESAPTQIVATITGGVGFDARFVVDGGIADTVTVDADPYQLVIDAVGEPGSQHRYRVEVLEGVTPVTLTSFVSVTTTAVDTRPVEPRGGGGLCTWSPAGSQGEGAGPWVLAAFGGLALSLRRRKR